MLRDVEVEEYGTREIALTSGELAHLLTFTRGVGDERRLIQALTPTGRPDIYVLNAGPYVGRLALPTGRVIDFTSRFSFDELVWLVCLSNRVPIAPDELVAGLAPARLPVHIIARAFAREVRRLVAQGLAKGYVERRFLHPPYPGRLDVTYHMSRLAARPDQLATIAKRLTTDTRVNQGLAAALDVLLRSDATPPDLTSVLTHLAPALRYVSRPPMTAADIGRIRLDRLTARYRTALGLAELILRMEAVGPVAGTRAGSSLLFYMPTVWEDFVSRWVARHVPAGMEVATQHRFPVSNDGTFEGKADVTVQHRGRTLAVFDAKYKWPAKAPTASDLYQLIAYCDRLDVTDATAVYPTCTGRRTVAVGSRRIHVVGVPPTPANLDGLVPPGLTPLTARSSSRHAI